MMSKYKMINFIFYLNIKYKMLYAAENGNIEELERLLDRGADINAKDNDDWTALMYASENSNDTSSIETVRLLLDRGADINATNNEGWTVLEIDINKECHNVISSYIWSKLYKRDKDTAKRFASISHKPKLPKDIWEIILLIKRLEQLCSNLSNNKNEKNKEILKLFAKEYGIPVTKEMNKTKLYELISKQISYGKIYA